MAKDQRSALVYALAELSYAAGLLEGLGRATPRIDDAVIVLMDCLNGMDYADE